MAITGAAAAFFAYLKSQQNSAKIEEVHLTFNSRMDELLKLAKKDAHAEGVIEGMAQGAALALSKSEGKSEATAKSLGHAEGLAEGRAEGGDK